MRCCVTGPGQLWLQLLLPSSGCRCQRAMLLHLLNAVPQEDTVSQLLHCSSALSQNDKLSAKWKIPLFLKPLHYSMFSFRGLGHCFVSSFALGLWWRRPSGQWEHGREGCLFVAIGNQEEAEKRPGTRYVLQSSPPLTHFFQSGPPFHSSHHLLIAYSIMIAPLDSSID